MTQARPKITDAQRRARLGARHLLSPAARASTSEAVAEAVLALHAADPASVYLSVAARLKDPSVADLERALYEDRTLVRMLCMRRTMFVVPRELAPVVDASTARAVAARERRNLARDIQQQLGFDEGWFAETETAVLAALDEHGEATAAQLADAVPDLKSKIVQAEGSRTRPGRASPAASSG